MFYFDSPQKKTTKKTPANQRLCVFREGGGWEGGQKGKLRRKGLIRSKF